MTLPATARLGQLALIAALGLALSPAALAAGGAAPNATSAATPVAAPAGAPVQGSDASTPLIGAEVRRIDRATARITLRHDEIRHLDMPPMTMVFTVADAGLLEGLSPGMAVRVRVERRDGALVVTRIDPASRP
jgi:Cu/Ag efflux protein CusF